MAKSVEEVRAEIPFLRTGIIYLDNAATTPTPKPVLDAMLEYFCEYSANIGRGLYSAAKRATVEFETTREKIAKVINTKPEEIAYAKNTTEAINIIAQGLKLRKGDKVVTTVLEHHSNLLPWQRLERQGIELELIPVSRECLVDPATIEEAIDDKTRIVTTHHVSNVVGSVQPVEEICKLAQKHDVLSLVDAAQSVGHMPLNVRKLGCDFLVAPGHKGLMGPQGTGFLYAHEDLLAEFEPLLVGGGVVKQVEEHKYDLIKPPQIFDAGTPNIPGIIGLGRACEYVLEIGIERIAKREQKLTEQMLRIADIEHIEVYGPHNVEQRGGVVSFNINGLGHHEVASMLDELAQIAVRSGHLCAQPAMRHLGVDGIVRASLHCYNLEREIERFTATLEQIARVFGS
jgi:cysteine desulfurase/selenocysteine lyase